MSDNMASLSASKFRNRVCKARVMLLPNFIQGPAVICIVNTWCRIALELQQVEKR